MQDESCIFCLKNGLCCTWSGAAHLEPCTALPASAQTPPDQVGVATPTPVTSGDRMTAYGTHTRTAIRGIKPNTMALVSVFVKCGKTRDCMRFNSSQGVQIAGHISCISLGDSEIGHGGERIHGWRILQPPEHILRGVGEYASNVHPTGDVLQ